MDIRLANFEDAALIAGLIRSMVEEMARYGGHAVDGSPQVWSSMAEQVKANLANPDCLYLLAASDPPAQAILGLAAGQIVMLEGPFLPKCRLHLSVVYTVPTARRRGLARRLVEEALVWGQRMGALEADLNVLAGNPARRLYQQIGFQPFEIAMVKKLAR